MKPAKGHRELEMVRHRYARRRLADDNRRYDMLRPEVILGFQERQRALVSFLSRRCNRLLENVDLIEVGCGSGGNLIELLRLGCDPSRLVGIELLKERADQARRLLPVDCKVIHGDASEAGFRANSFDIVYQSTVFTSLLDHQFQAKLAARMWSWVRPGGAVLWYDFIYDNPKNPDVRGMPIGRIRALFPDGRVCVRRVTLAPPISRRVCRIHPSAYHVFNSIPWLRTHALCWIGKNS